ncbi:MAG: glycerophosphodiester phosphodiesterase [Gemmatimonadota bacterium]
MKAAYPWPYARVLAHRGGGALAPENTLAAIEVGLAHGFRAIEFDTRLAGDGVPVVIHDATLDRTTNGTGPVAAHSAAELGRLDAGSWCAPRFAGATVSTLEAVITYCRAHFVWPNVEIKRVAGDEERAGAVIARTAATLYADLVRPHGDRAGEVEPRVPLLTSFSRTALIGARRAAPDLPRGFLVKKIPANWRDELEALGCVSLQVSHEFLTAAAARAVKAAGYWLFCYTVDDPARARKLLDWGVDAFCTDRIDLIGPDFA